jgi:hypothetical protein
LPPEVVRATNSADSECAFSSSDEAGQVISNFFLTKQLDETEEEEFKRFRTETAAALSSAYPLCKFDNECMFLHSHRGSLKVVHLNNIATLLSHVSKENNTVRVTMGAPHHDAAPEGGYPTNSDGYVLPPVKIVDAKGAVAIAERDLEAIVRVGLNSLYFNQESPLFQGINSGHTPFIKAFLKLKSSQKILEDLAGTPPIFHSQAADDYMQKNSFSGGWANAEILHSTHSIPAKGSFPPDPNAKGPPMIPQIVFNASSSSSSSSGSGGNPLSTGAGLALVAAALNKGEDQISSVRDTLKIDPSNLTRYQTWVNLKVAAAFSDADSNALETEGWDDLDVLSTMVECVIAQNPINFLQAIKAELPTTLTPNGCIRLITAMKKDPTQNATDL